ncbi:hypothetical protein EON83_01165 [bacterium]|nr:MAG: hypothetical protein EON83_01165 [bacterium]
MKTINTKKMLLGAALLGALTVGGTISSAEAQPRRGNRPGGRPFVRTQTFTGRVTKVRSWNSFDINAAGRVYNVYLRGNAPRRLDVNDRVRVTGVRQDSNDIRNATVSIIRNR